MKFSFVLFFLFFAIQTQAQTVAAGPKLLTISGTNAVFTVLDTNAVALRYMTRTGPWYSQRQLDSVKALGVITQRQIDSLKSLPPDSMLLQYKIGTQTTNKTYK